MDAATVSIPVSITAIVGAAFFAGRMSERIAGVQRALEKQEREAKEAAKEAETRARESAKDQGQRLGKIDDELAVLRDFKSRMEGVEVGRKRERADTRGIPVRVPEKNESNE